MCKCAYVNAIVCVQRLENNLEVLFLFLHHVGHRDQTQMIRLGSKCLYLLRYLTNPYLLDVVWNHLGDGLDKKKITIMVKFHVFK